MFRLTVSVTQPTLSKQVLHLKTVKQKKIWRKIYTSVPQSKFCGSRPPHPCGLHPCCHPACITRYWYFSAIVDTLLLTMRKTSLTDGLMYIQNILRRCIVGPFDVEGPRGICLQCLLPMQ